MMKKIALISLIFLLNCSSTNLASNSNDSSDDSGASGSIDWSDYESKFSGDCTNTTDSDGTWDYTYTLSNIAEVDPTVAPDGTNALLLQCMLENTAATTDGCFSASDICATSSVCTFTDALTAQCAGGGETGLVGCTTPEECSLTFPLSALPDNWERGGFGNDASFDSCATLTFSDTALLISTINDSQCNTGSGNLGEVYTGDTTDLTLMLTIDSWSNMTGNGSGIGIQIENGESETRTLVVSMGPSGNRRCIYTSGQEGADCDLGATNSSTPITLKLILFAGNIEAEYKIGSGSFQSLGSQTFDSSPGIRLEINIINQLDGLNATISDFTMTTP